MLAGLSEDRRAARSIVDSYGLDSVLAPLRERVVDEDLLCNSLRTVLNIAVDGKLFCLLSCIHPDSNVVRDRRE